MLFYNSNNSTNRLSCKKVKRFNAYITKCLCYLYMLFFVATNDVLSQPVKEIVNKLATDASLKSAGLSFTIIDKASGGLIYSHNPHLALVPASSMKLLSCAYGLKTLGKDFRFRTDLEYTGSIDSDGVLRGDLIIKGYGDPSLGSEMTNGAQDLDRILNLWVDAIRKKGIRKVEGRIYGDATFLSDEGIYDSWQWADIGNYYAAGAYGLNIFDNLFKLKLKQTKQGGSPLVRTTNPNIPGLNFANSLICAGPTSGDNAYIYGGPLQYQRAIRGTIPAGTGEFEIKGSQPDPPATAAMLLRQKLALAGIESRSFAGSLTSNIPEGKRIMIESFYSSPLKEIVTQTLLKSLNLNAEGIVRYCHAVKNPGSKIEDALKSFNQFLESQSGQRHGFIVADGSGLSSQNCISSFGFAGFLQEMFKDKAISGVLTDALPVAGVSGTLKGYLKNSKAAAKVKAKTGSMNRVRSFSGLLTGASGKEYVFSLIINNYTCNSAQIKSKVEALFEGLFTAL